MSKPADYIAPDSLNILYSSDEIARTVERMATEIKASLGDDFMVVALLKGSFVFAADLVRALHRNGCTPQIDFMTLSSYGDARQSSHNVTVERDLSDEVKGKHILLVDDILESGRTLSYAKGVLHDREAKSVSICVLLEKPGKLAVDMKADFIGFTIPDRFVVGYGLDYANYYRELPFIGALDG